MIAHFFRLFGHVQPTDLGFQLLQQRLRLLQIARVEPFSEPAINRSKQFVAPAGSCPGRARGAPCISAAFANLLAVGVGRKARVRQDAAQ